MLNVFSKTVILSFVMLLISTHTATAEDGEENLVDKVGTHEIASRLLRPWGIVFLSSREALVTEKEGGLQKINLVNGSKTLIKGLPADLENRNKTGIGDNSGLFAIALDPDFSENQWVYLSYSAANPERSGFATKIIRGKYKNDSLSAIETLFVAAPYTAERYHYGGGLVFGQDGKLYITLGERLFSEADQPEMPIAQNTVDNRGKIIRLNSDGSIPSDNPKFTEPSVPGLYGLGIRAAQHLTVHPKTGRIWFSEHGTQQGDEINLLSSRANYGWPIHTDGGYRDKDYNPPKLQDRKFVAPAWSWPITVAPTGLTFYFGNEFPEWNGSLLVTGLSRGSFWRMTVDGNKIIGGEELMSKNRIRLRAVKQAPDGKLYVITDEANGRILRITQ